MDISHNSKYLLSKSALNKLTMQNCKVSGLKSNYLYTGNLIKPEPTVRLSGKTLKQNKDYKITYKNNRSAGTATITITGIGSYAAYGSRKLTFRILKMADCKVSGLKSTYTYTGKYLKPSMTVKLGGVTLKRNTDYKITYKNNKNVGTATVTIAGIGKYKSCGSRQVTFRIIPQKTSVASLSGGKQAVTVKWGRKTVQTSGYQLQYSTSSGMKSAKLITVSGSKNTGRTIKNLQPGKKYYVRVRTYKAVGGRKYYSGWSKIKSVKTK